MVKDQSIVELLTMLRLDERGWQVVDHWEADLMAVGVADRRAPRRLVYVSTLGLAPGRYYYQCEKENGQNIENYIVVGEDEDIGYQALVKVLEAHLSPPTS